MNQAKPADPPPPTRPTSTTRLPIHDGPPTLLYSIKQVELAIRHHLDDLLKPAGITALQYTALTILERRDRLSITALARNSFVTVPSMADQLRPLYQRRLITREPDPNHGRRQLISLTDTGHALLNQYQDRVDQFGAEDDSPAGARRRLASQVDAGAMPNGSGLTDPDATVTFHERHDSGRREP